MFLVIFCELFSFLFQKKKKKKQKDKKMSQFLFGCKKVQGDLIFDWGYTYIGCLPNVFIHFIYKRLFVFLF